MSSRRRVYLAGPISRGDLVHNIRQADEAFAALIRAGFAPLCPHWSAFSGSVFGSGEWVCGTARPNGGLGLEHADWLAADLAWVAVADAVLRLPGISTGADLETDEATRLCIPVFHSVAELVAWADAREWGRDAVPTVGPVS